MLNKPKLENTIDPNLTRNLKIAIVRTDYYEEINKRLEKQCISTLTKHGVNKENIKTFVAPGTWEIPLITQAVVKSKKYDAIIAFGVVVKGDTYHFEIIANECARALMQLSLDHSLPITNEILAVYDVKDAEKRAQDDNNNKGIEGALAALKSLKTLKLIKA